MSLFSVACISFRAPEPPQPVTSADTAVASPGIVLDPATLPPRFAAADSEYFAGHPLMVPVEGIAPDRLRDNFYEARDGTRMHLSLDILAPRGTPVLAAADGKIRRMAQNALGGITVYTMDADERYVFYYAHLDHYSDAATVGLEVKQGEVLGYVGTSGNAPPDTPHLHFQAMRLEKGKRDWWNGTPVDVRPFLLIRGEQRQ